MMLYFNIYFYPVNNRVQLCSLANAGVELVIRYFCYLGPVCSILTIICHVLDILHSWIN